MSQPAASLPSSGPVRRSAALPTPMRIHTPRISTSMLNPVLCPVGVRTGFPGRDGAGGCCQEVSSPDALSLIFLVYTEGSGL